MEPMNTELPQNPVTPLGEVVMSSLSPCVMEPSLLIASSNGDYERLRILLSWGDSPVRPAPVAPQVVVDVPDGDTFDVNDVPNESLAAQPTSSDVVEEFGPDQPNDASNGSLASQEVAHQPAGNATDEILTLQQASITEAGTDQLGNNTDGSSDMQQTPPEAVQQGVDQPAVPPSESILGGTTPQGDTALHVVAKSGSSGDNFLRSVYVIYNKAKHLLDATNEMGDTPLHCAARTGNYGMVSYLVDLVKCEADGSEKLKTLLRKQNKRGETLLHEAIRSGNEDIVSLLLTEDSELARVPSLGTSPLYLAILLGKYHTAKKLYEKDNQLSYSGPDGQNALHAAVIRDIGMIKLLLEWNVDLTKQRDKYGSTPLHFSVSWGEAAETSLLLETNPSSVYQPDITGSFPIHTAAAQGQLRAVINLLEKCPNCANLCDLRGRTFLHVAVEKQRNDIVAYACRQPRFAPILNMQDFDGNTAIHLAVQAGNLRIFCSLLGNSQAGLNIPNYNGQTARHLSESVIPPGFFYARSRRKLIRRSLTYARSWHGNYRKDHFEQQHKHKKSDKAKESDKLKDSTQTLAIGSVLIATVTFGATFALPGGYKADDHINGGTPTLAGRFTFNAFMVANTLAFICSALSTIGLMYSGMAMVDLPVRYRHFNLSLSLVTGSLTSMAAAFALGVYTVLAPVAHITAITICVMVCAMTLYLGQAELPDTIIIARALRSRIGNRAFLSSADFIFTGMLAALWPLIPVVVLAAISTKVQRK